MPVRPALATRRRLTVAAAALSAVAVGAAVVPAQADAPRAAAPTAARATAAADLVTWSSGTYSGISRDENNAFAAWRGRANKVVLQFQPSSSRDDMANPGITAQYKGGPHVVLSTAMWPASENGSLRAAAAGAYSNTYKQLATNLVKAGMPNVTLRMGWEFNGDWMPWRVLNAQDAAYFAQAWRRNVNAVRSVPGGRFTFDWAPVASNNLVDPSRSWPGAAYVNVIGMSVYNYTPNALQNTPARRFATLTNWKYGLKWHQAFAAKVKRPTSFPEWAGLNRPFNPKTSSGDDPYFIAAMFNWFRKYRPMYEMYFDVDTVDFTFYGINTGSGVMNKSAAEYRRRW